MRGIFGLACGLVSVAQAEDNVFKKVVTALEDALADAKSAQQANDDEFAKVKCKADEKIKEANERIPVHQQKIAESKARQAEIRAENEELSIAAADLDASVRKLTKELADKQAKRDADKLAYETKSGDMNVGVDMMKKAIQTLTSGTANFLFLQTQKFASATKASRRGEEVMALTQEIMQLGSKTGSSGQIIGILRSMKDTFESDLATMEAEEMESAKLFKGYKQRTEKQIDDEKLMSANKKSKIADNVTELKTVQLTLKTNEEGLEDMEIQLKDNTELLEENTKYHEKITAESAALQKAIANAVELLTSNAAMEAMKKVDTIKKVSMPTFTQVFSQMVANDRKEGHAMRHWAPASASMSLLARTNAVISESAEAQRKRKAAGEYGWGAIYEAIKDMTSALKDELSEAEEKFETCENQLRQHVKGEQDLKAKKLKWETDLETQEGIIKEAEDSIDQMQTEIKKRNLEVQQTTTAIREEQAAMAKEKGETEAAHKLFTQAIEFLKEFEAVDVQGPNTGAGAFDSSTLSTGTDKVVAIVQKVDDDMMKELKDMMDESEVTITKYQDTVSTAKKVIKESEKTLSEAKDTLVDATRAKENAVHWLDAAKEGLAAEKAWFGPAPGNKLPAPGEDCAAFMGKMELMQARDDEYSATEAEAGDGGYHKLTKANKDELDALDSLKTEINNLQKAYLEPQPKL